MVSSFQNYFESKFKIDTNDDDKHMEWALKAAERAKSKGDLAIGAVLVWPDSNTLSEHDTTYSDNDVTAFAEINLLRKASQTMLRRIDEAVLYTTLEPNAACALTACSNGVKEIVFGAYNDKDGFVSSDKALDLEKWNIAYRGGILAEDCFKLLPQHVKEHTRVS